MYEILNMRMSEETGKRIVALAEEWDRTPAQVLNVLLEAALKALDEGVITIEPAGGD